MGTLRGQPALRPFARLGVLAFGCLALANCNQTVGSVDPKYGVSASPRVVEYGQAVPKGGGVYRVGKPYMVAGRMYVPEEDVNYHAEGLASWYGADFHGRLTANGEVFDMDSIAAAHPTLPMPCYVRVTNLGNRRSIIVRVNDRGPYHANRVIDVSKKTAELLGFAGNGIARVRVEYVGRAPLEGSDDRKLIATLRENGQQAQSPVQVASAGGKPFLPEYFDNRSMVRSSVPLPSERPYTLGEPSGEPAEAVAEPARGSVELAARSRVPSVAVAQAQPPRAMGEAEGVQLTSPVTAYAPPAAPASAPTGFMSGRGLY
jgi:rare lipoprotein A